MENVLVSKALATQISGPEFDFQHWWLRAGCDGPISSALSAEAGRFLELLASSQSSPTCRLHMHRRALVSQNNDGDAVR